MGTGHNLRRVFLYYFSSARKGTNCAIIPIRPCGHRMLYFLESWSEASKKRSDRDFSRMLIVMSVKPTLTDELLKVNSALKSIFSVIEDQCSGGQWFPSEEDGTSEQTHVNFVNKQPSGFRFHQVLRCFTVVWSHFCTTSKFLSASETTTNNQKVKRSWYRLQNVNNLPKDYIRMCVTCRSLNFIGLV